jgi:hypothetical protein
MTYELPESWHSAGCTGLTAGVTLSDDSTTTLIGGVFPGSSTEELFAEIQIPEGMDVASVQSAGFTCDLIAFYDVPKTFYRELTKFGAQWSSRGIVKTYSPRGSCDWANAVLDTLRSRCRHARAQAVYRLRLPDGKTFVRIKHFAADGQSTCWNRRWGVSHVGRWYKIVFSHGSAIGRSECIIGYITLRYKWVGTEEKTEYAQDVVASWTSP